MGLVGEVGVKVNCEAAYSKRAIRAMTGLESRQGPSQKEV